MKKILFICLLLVFCLGGFFVGRYWEDIFVEEKFFSEQKEDSGKYLWIDGTDEVVSGIMYLDEDVRGYLHFPTGKYSTLYLSGNGESHVFLLGESSQDPERVQEQIVNLQYQTYLQDEILYNFYKASGHKKREDALMILGDWGNLSTIFDLPRDKALQQTTTLVSFLQDSESEVFRELSNKETYLVNEGGAVMEYLKGYDYSPAYKGLDPDGENFIQ